MKLIYQDKSISLVDCNTFFKRFFGFMGKANIDHALLFNHCSSIHTFFMRESIDVILLDKDNTILYYYKNLQKNKVILPKKNVVKTIELPTNYFNFKPLEKIDISND